MKVISRFIKKNILISIFIGLILFTGFIAIIKYPFSKTKDFYVKVKLGQGLWWANSTQPGIWFLDYLKKGEKEYSFVGKPDAEIIGVRYYQQTFSNQTYQAFTSPNQFDIYLLVKISATGDSKNGYSFKRSQISVGVPIDLDFNKAQVSGTVVAIYQEKPETKYVEKDITFTKRLAFPWEYDVIKVGDKYFNGEENILEITGKQSFDTQSITDDLYGNLSGQLMDQKKYIIVNAKIKLRENSAHQYIYGEEQVLKENSYVNLVTNNVFLTDFYISEIK